MSKPVTVFIAGAFDALHYGHINILKRARALGDELSVGINDDSYCAAKGPHRPIDTASVRTKKLIDTGLVDWVYTFSGSPLSLIKTLKPDIIAVGDDYTVETTVGYPECVSWGGEVIILPRTPHISTTAIVEAIREYHDIPHEQR